MAPTETIKWVAVPNGYDASGNLRLSVMIAPELAGGSGTLSQFPDFQDWPSAINLIRQGWHVTFTNHDGSVNGVANIPLDASKLNSTLWTILFPSSLSYGPPDPVQNQFRAIAVASYPALHVGNFLLGQYQNYSPTEVPTLDTLKTVYGPISSVLVGVASGGPSGGAGLNPHFQRLAAERAANSKGGTVPHANNFSSATPADAFAAQAFYHLPGAGTQPAPGVETVDFHRALTFVGQHGVLQRALGLVFDVVIPTTSILDPSSGAANYASLFPASPTDVFVSVRPVRNPAGQTTSINPRTHCDGSTSVFEAHPATQNIAAGRQLAVGTPQSNAPALYNAHVIDLDGAGLRASNFATQIQLAEAPATINPAHTAAFVLPDLAATAVAPPMIRSNGLTLTEVNRGVNFASTLARAFSLLDATDAFIQNPQTSQIPDLTAEDLVRGFVLDVIDEQNNIWRSTAERLVTYSAPAQSPTVTISSSSVAPFDEASTQAPPRSQSSPLDENSSQANLSEVVLRYNGWSNAVDRPGTPLQDADSQASGGNPGDPFPSKLNIAVSPPAGRLPPLRFGHTYAMRARIVDVANNVIDVGQGADIGDKLGRVSDPMVYGRHEPIGSPDLYSQSVPRRAESLMRLVVRDIDGLGTSMRAVAPQRCQEPFAEWHGMFDASNALDPASFGSNNHTIYNEIVGRESGHYPPPPNPPTNPPTPIDLTAAVPYLPDPLARGAVITVVDGPLAGKTYTFDFSPASGHSWPDYRPFGLKLVPGSAQSESTDANNRVLTFTIAAADTVTLQLSSTCNVADIDLFALKDLFPSGTFVASDAAAGKYWAITPAVTLELIYAVQKPLLTPEFPNFPAPGRQPGATFASLAADLRWSPKSTSKIDLLADWGDPVDDPVHNLPVQGPGAPNPNLRQTSDSHVVTLPSTTSGLASAGSQQSPATDRFAARHEFFDTKHRNVTYHGVATSRFTEFYAPGTAVTKATATPVTVNVPSSARPDTAKIAYVVPIYAWGLTKTGNRTVSQRSPSALRVFIERPWWSSGIDELLGVVTWPGAEPGFVVHPFGGFFKERHDKRRHLAFPGGGGINSAIPDDQAQYVTDWGADPVFAGPALPSLHPRLASFPHATHNGTGLSIEEKAGINVNVAGHPVAFDAGRNLWYCDVAVDTGAAYTPMIRLALARYQPNSIPGAELSRIVLADIMSLEPGRVATVVRKNSTTLSSVSLSGFSYSHAAGARNVAPGEAVLVVERRSGIQDDALGWEQVGDPIRMTPHGARDGSTTWSASNVKLPSKGTLRLAINQYEVLPTDNRELTRGFYLLAQRSRELRLMHQDLIPL